MEKIITQFFVAIMALTCFTACDQGQSASEPEEASLDSSRNYHITLTQQQIDAVDLKLGNIKKMSLENTIKANGYTHIPPQYIASVSVYMGGYIQQANLLVGDYVKKGQVLAILENPEYLDLQQKYLEAKSQLKFLENELQRQQTLNQENINARKDLYKAEADYQQALALYNSTREKLKMMHIDLEKVDQGNFTSRVFIVAPISGYINANNAEIGRYIDARESIYEIINKDHMHLELNVFEQDILKLKKGQKVHFNFPNQGDQLWQGEVFLVAQSLNDETRTIQVHVHIENEDKIALMEGMYVNANIVVGDGESKALPENAIVRSGQKSYIFIKDNSKVNQTAFSRVEVSTGISNNGWVAIEPVDKVNDQAEVVVNGAFYLLTAMENSEEI
ncbi:MAG: efflux RND transporter periplasmic adaptor subunit [Candidatus Cyclobacteriaceae bacterium M3_2C_046]